jgi:Glyoxalase/Bleomycin resistance protein/Dioxygenase superfamily
VTPELSDSPFHVALVVDDVRRHADLMTRRYGWTWTPIRTRHQTYREFPSGLIREVDVDVCFSKHVPFRMELISHASGSPWEVSDGQAFHHLAWWVDDLAAVSAALLERGAVPEAHGVDPDTGREPARFAYFTEAGVRIELQESSRRPDFEAWFAE